MCIHIFISNTFPECLGTTLIQDRSATEKHCDSSQCAWIRVRSVDSYLNNDTSFDEYHKRNLKFIFWR